MSGTTSEAIPLLRRSTNISSYQTLEQRPLKFEKNQDEKEPKISLLENLSLEPFKKIRSYLPVKDQIHLISCVSKKIKRAFPTPSTAIIYQIYQDYLPKSATDEQQQADLKRLLQNDLRFAHRMSMDEIYCPISCVDSDRGVEPDLPLAQGQIGSQDFFLTFPEFQQIIHLVSQPGFFNRRRVCPCCCPRLDQWKWSLPLRSGGFMSLKQCFYSSFRTGLSGSCIWLCTTCCCPIEAIYGPAIIIGGCAALPSLTACGCGQWGQFPEILTRLRAIRRRHSPKKLKTLISSLHVGGQDTKRLRFSLDKVIQLAYTIRKRQTFLGGMEALRKKLNSLDDISLKQKGIVEITDLETVWLINKARLVARDCLNSKNIPWDFLPQDNSIEILKKVVEGGDLKEMQDVIVKNCIDVNLPGCCEILLKACEDKNNPVIDLFIHAGSDLAAIPLDLLTSSHLSQLLQLGIFAEEPALLDRLSQGYHYEFAVVLFLYGFDSESIKKQLGYHPKVFNLLKTSRQPDEQTSNSSLHCDRFLKRFNNNCHCAKCHKDPWYRVVTLSLNIKRERIKEENRQRRAAERENRGPLPH